MFYLHAWKQRANIWQKESTKQLKFAFQHIWQMTPQPGPRVSINAFAVCTCSAETCWILTSKNPISAGHVPAESRRNVSAVGLQNKRACCRFPPGPWETRSAVCVPEQRGGWEGNLVYPQRNRGAVVVSAGEWGGAGASWWAQEESGGGGRCWRGERGQRGRATMGDAHRSSKEGKQSGPALGRRKWTIPYKDQAETASHGPAVFSSRSWDYTSACKAPRSSAVSK